MGPYEIRKPFLGIFGKPKLVYCCEACGVTLESPMFEAGTNQPCPACGISYIVPGVREAELQREADERVRIAKALANAARAELAAREAMLASGPPPLPLNQFIEKECFSKIAGVQQINADGISRQGVLKKCRVGEMLKFIREPNNRFDRNAIMITRSNGVQVGYVTANLAVTVAPAMDAGGAAWAVIKEFAGGKKDSPTIGANLLVKWTDCERSF